MSGLRRLFRGARLLDPDSGRDGVGDIIVVDDRVAAIGANISTEGLGLDVEVVDALPTNASGKVLKTELRELFAQRPVKGA